MRFRKSCFTLICMTAPQTRDIELRGTGWCCGLQSNIAHRNLESSRWWITVYGDGKVSRESCSWIIKESSWVVPASSQARDLTAFWSTDCVASSVLLIVRQRSTWPACRDPEWAQRRYKRLIDALSAIWVSHTNLFYPSWSALLCQWIRRVPAIICVKSYGNRNTQLRIHWLRRGLIITIMLLRRNWKRHLQEEINGVWSDCSPKWSIIQCFLLVVLQLSFIWNQKKWNFGREGLITAQSSETHGKKIWYVTHRLKSNPSQFLEEAGSWGPASPDYLKKQGGFQDLKPLISINVGLLHTYLQDFVSSSDCISPKFSSKLVSSTNCVQCAYRVGSERFTCSSRVRTMFFF